MTGTEAQFINTLRVKWPRENALISHPVARLAPDLLPYRRELSELSGADGGFRQLAPMVSKRSQIEDAT
jgi:hypothetical protein